MATAIVLPHDGAGAPRLHQFSGAPDYQSAVGGWLEPLELPRIGIAIYANAAARAERLPTNSRATALWLFFGRQQPVSRPLLLGTVVLAGLGPGGDVPTRIAHQVLAPHDYMVQVSEDGEAWDDTHACYPSFFDALTWCMLLGCIALPGQAIRIDSQHCEIGC